ncbi:MAG: hypothetical protein ACKOB0_13400, partial [Chthoniobacterales bacterium]
LIDCRHASENFRRRFQATKKPRERGSSRVPDSVRDGREYRKEILQQAIFEKFFQKPASGNGRSGFPKLET